MSLRCGLFAFLVIKVAKRVASDPARLGQSLGGVDADQSVAGNVEAEVFTTKPAAVWRRSNRIFAIFKQQIAKGSRVVQHR